jgi:hypothetical protein
VYSKLHCLNYFAVALTIGLVAGLAQAQSTAPAQTTVPEVQVAPQTPASATTATVRGHVTDQTGALIPGATVTVTTAAGASVNTTTANSTGTFSVSGLEPGNYFVQANYQGFAPFQSKLVTVTAGQILRLEISMAVEVEQQSVVVTDESPTVSVDAGSNASTVVLKGKDLEALSDDPDELANELDALAGPSAGPNGGQIYIDGFTGGTLPPKSAIREIRINSNPYSAEFDRIGYGRIEILTKPGTDALHGRAFLQGNDSSFNTDNPFVAPPTYHSIQYNGTVSGSINKKASYFLSVEGRNTPDASIYSVEIPVFNPATGLYSYPTGLTTGALNSTANRIEISPRIDLQLGQKNTLTVRYQYERGSSSGGIGSTSLPTQSTSSSSTEHSVQLSDSQIINDHIVNETRIQYRHEPSVTTPVSFAPSVSVPGYFTGGGSSSSSDHSDHLELQNVTTMSAGTHAIKFGTWLRDNRNANTSNGGFNGSFSFPSLNAYIATLNGLAQHQTITQIATNCTAQQIQLWGGCTPNRLNITQGNQKYQANVFDAALFFQDDWKFNPFLTLSGGLRWESQNHIADHSDFAPRVAFAYALDGHKDKKQAKTVLRAGDGFFYDRFQVGNLMGLARDNGGPNSQSQYVITNPTCFNPDSMSNVTLASCNGGVVPTTKNQQTEQIKPNYHSPYNEQFGVSLERQLTKVSTLSLTYVHTYGVHQMATIDANAYLPGTYVPSVRVQPAQRPNPNLGVINEIYPEAVFKQNQLIANISARFTPKFNVNGFYTLNFANGNTGTASNSNNLKQDYGRAAFVGRQMVFLMGSYTGKWGISYNPFLVAQAGRPYNITTNVDLTGDNFFNDRPSIASSSSACSSGNAQYAQTSFGCLDTVPQPGETLLPINFGNGPAAVAVNLRVSRSFGIGPKTAPVNSGNNAGGASPIGGIGGGAAGAPAGRGGGGGGMGGGGGFGGPGGGRGGMSNTGHKYSLTFSAQALNLFNDIDYGTPSGNVVPALLPGSTTVYGPGDRFGVSTSLARGIFSSPSGSAARRVFIQAAFSF